MKKHLNLISLAAFAAFLCSCGPKFNGQSDKTFVDSKKVVEAKLTKQQDSTLEKALAVTAGEAMRLKFEEDQRFSTLSMDEIVLKLVDGKTYSSLVSQAEDFLQQSNKRKATQLSDEIDTLEKQRSTNDQIRKTMGGLFKLKSTSLELTDFIDKKVPNLRVVCTYTGKQPLTGKAEVAIILSKIDTHEIIEYNMWQQENGDNKLAPGDEFSDNIILDNFAKKDPQKWNALKYPIDNPDLRSLNMNLDVHPEQLTLNGQLTGMPKETDAALAAQIKSKQAELKEIQSEKGTLDEYNLSSHH